MLDQHLTYFHIKNFKRFESLEVKNIGQINLIVGDNNVGKTSFLEALILNSKIKENLGVFYTILKSKNPLYRPAKMSKSNPSSNHNSNVFAQFLNDKNKAFELLLRKKDPTHNLKYKVEHKNEKLSQQENEELKEFARKVIEEYPEIDTLSENWLFSFVDDRPNYIVDLTSKFYSNFVTTPWALPMISMKDSYDEALFFDYAKFNPAQENKIVALINKVFKGPLIERIRILEDIIQVTTQDRPNYYHSITEFGDGLLRIFRFIVTIMSIDNARLMIDEVDIGIHHSKQKELWKILLELSTETEIQLFCTTHSQEGIEAFMNAAKETRFEDKIRLIELEQGKEKTYASTYTFDQIKAGIISNVNLRG